MTADSWVINIIFMANQRFVRWEKMTWLRYELKIRPQSHETIVLLLNMELRHGQQA